MLSILKLHLSDFHPDFPVIDLDHLEISIPNSYIKPYIPQVKVIPRPVDTQLVLKEGQLDKLTNVKIC